jgi:predicted transcriptional regulator
LHLTSIHRYYLFNRVLKKQKFEAKYFYLLYTVYLLEPVGMVKIIETLIRVKHEHNGTQLKNYLKFLVNHNYINKDENKKYSVTDTGLSLLKEIENRLRKERHDK